MTSRPVEPVTIVCAYPDGALPNAWFRAYKRVRRGLRTRGLGASVALLPITDLPAAVDVLAVPPELAGVDTGPGVRKRLVAAPDDLQKALNLVVEELVDQGRLAVVPPPPRAVALHVGFQPVAERARLPE